MKTPFFYQLSLSLGLVLSAIPAVVVARGNDSVDAVKAAEARLRSSGTSAQGRARSTAEQRGAPIADAGVRTENFLTKRAARFSRPPAPVKASGESEMPVVTVRESRAQPNKPTSVAESRRFDRTDLGKLVSGIV